MIQLKPNKLIRLGGKLYDIRYTPDDITRREDGTYSTQEIKLLNDIGLTDIPEFPSETYPQYLKESIESVLDRYLIKILYSKQLLLDLVKTYPTFEKVQEYADIWRMYTMLKN